MSWPKIARQTFQDQRNKKTTLKSAKRTVSHDNRAFNLLHTFLEATTLSIYRKNGHKILKLKFTYFYANTLSCQIRKFNWI